MNTVNIPGIARILVVHEDLATCARLRSLFTGEGAVVETATDAEGVRAARRARRFDVALLERALDPNGTLLAALCGETAVVLLAPSAPDGVVDAMRRGALDVLAVDASDDRVLATVRRCLEERQARVEVDRAADRVRELVSVELIGLSPAMRAVNARLDQFAHLADAPVLITGAPGTGKELAARCLHARSPRRHGPFVLVNCAAWANGQLEAELFGSEPGVVDRAGTAGRIHEAAGGTLFLDAIECVDTHIQAKLVRVIHDRVARRVGGSSDVHVDVRILAASSKELEDAAHPRALRDDLLLTLDVRRLDLPELSERAADVPLLAHYFLGRFAHEMGKSLAGFTENAMETLCEYRWPGNVRELKNAIERAAIAATAGTIDEAHLPAFHGGRLDGRDLLARGQIRLEVDDRSLHCVEGKLVERVLGETNWNISRAAAVLGINRTTLYNKIKLHKLERQPTA